MVNILLAEDYYRRAKIRFKLLSEILKEKDYPDVIREAQEVVELCQKALLIKVGIQPPKWHDVIDVLLENKDKYSEGIREKLVAIRRECKWLRSQREIAFYGDMDFIPLKEYEETDAIRAINIAEIFLKLVEELFERDKNQ